MKPDEQAAAIMRYGYSERQGRFLTLVARHGGYFLRRQFEAFLGRAGGATASEFLRNAMTRRHVVSGLLEGHFYVYHLKHTGVYAAIDVPFTKNRLAHQLRAIRQRVMTLDLVLAHPTLRFLATDSERREFFINGLQVPAALLPNSLPKASNRGSQLLFGVAPDDRISCVHVDDADRTGFAFERKLRTAVPLCHALSRAIDIVFATPIDGQQRLAERVFTRVFGDPAHAPVTRAGRADEIAAYVRARHRYETDDLYGLQQRELDVIREILHRPPKPLGDMWYRRWLGGGDAAIQAMLGSVQGLDEPHLRLIVHRLPFDYRPLGLWLGGPC